ncbi:CPXCG motif-containing cysteine-rich protein [Aquisalimonas sp.]|uniref:CPXCG motif-containing cysteine-rich protein n=1 Tax=unclassified Aquisalimonas TaxID=2644645 RepID=UPI0025BC436B|nr:CPXCG motif-containing cysteine-rich protein [Aquisalimonas sp.]
MITETTVDCPYCGEPFTTLVDYSEGEQRYIEDCQVCCQPIEFVVAVDASGELADVTVLRDDE